MAYRLLLALLFFWLSRLLFYIFNTHYFSQLGFQELVSILFWGLRFDISGLLMLNAPFLLMMSIPLPVRRNRVWRSVAGFFFYSGNILGLMANFTDSVYFRFTQKRMTGDIFEFLGGEVDMLSLMPQFIHDYWPYQLTFIGLSVLLVVLSRKIKYRPQIRQWSKLLNFAYQFFAFLLVMSIMIIGVRGGFQLKPINIITAGKVTDAPYAALVLNTPFTIIKTMNVKSLEHKNYFSEKECNSIYSPVFKSGNSLSDSADFQSKNVVILIIESLSSEHIGAFNRDREGYAGFTPFLDSLMGHAMVFQGFANGKQSIEGVPSIVASLPSLMDRPYINSAYAVNSVNTLANLLNQKNYTTAFYHGGTNGTMDFDGFADMAGFQNYYGRTEYDNEEDFDGNWGIFDEPFYKYFTDKLNETQEPFFTTFFSLSSHHPYTIPEEHKGKFRDGNLEIQKAIMYADYALGRFFKQASQQAWYNETIFVITADHTSEAYLPEYQNRVGMYKIPLVFFAPGVNLKSANEKTASQVDIMPTILGLLNYEEPYLAFGQDLLSETSDSFAVNYINGVYQIFSGEFVLHFDGEQSIALYNYHKDPLLKNNLQSSLQQKVESLETTLKAYIQQYNNRMIENKLTIVD